MLSNNSVFVTSPSINSIIGLSMNFSILRKLPRNKLSSIIIFFGPNGISFSIIYEPTNPAPPVKNIVLFFIITR